MANPKDEKAQPQPKRQADPKPQAGSKDEKALTLVAIAPILNGTLDIEESLLYVECDAAGGNLLGIYATAFPHLTTSENNEPEPDEDLYWLGANRYGGRISYPVDQLFRVRFRAEFEDTDAPENPNIILHSTVGMPDGFDD